MPSRSIIRTGVGPHREPRNRFPAMAAAINLLAARAARVQSRRNLSRSLSPKLDHSHSITRFDRSRTGPKYHWGRAAIQTAFTIFVATETWLVPVEAWFVDRYGPRIVVMFGAVMITLAWIINAYASSLLALYAAAMIAGVGAGSVYGTCVGNALKWFPDWRGLAAGATAAGFGAGAAITVVPIANVIASRGYESAFLWFGIGQGVIVFLMSFVLRKPPIGVGPVQKRKLKVQQAQFDRTPAQAVRTPVFWVMGTSKNSCFGLRSAILG